MTETVLEPPRIEDGHRPAFHVTFGDRYARKPHPRFTGAHPDGYVTLIADDERHAREVVMSLLGPYWSDLYQHEPPPTLFPRGELLLVIAPIREDPRP